jgi:hypothetical protein
MTSKTGSDGTRVSTVLSNEFGYNNGKWNVFSGPVLAGMVASFGRHLPRKQIKKSEI